MRWFFLLLVLAACSSPPKSANRLRISFHTQPATLDPRKAGDFTSSTLVCMIYEGLTRCLPGGAVEPALAEWVEVSKDQRTYTFHLRKAFWSDGKAITAHDFEKSWKKILNPPGLCAYLFYPIKNAEKCAKGEIAISEVGIQAIDDRTLRVELEYPTSYFYSLTAFPSYLPVPSHSDNSIVCSGPFYIEKMIPNSEIILKKNLNFWNQGEILLDEIQIRIVPDEMTALQMFERGDLDWLGGPLSPLPPDALEKIKDQITFIPSAATTLCTFNTQIFPFHNLHLRKAFSYAIDRNEIVKQVATIGQIPATSFLPPSLTQQNLLLSDLTLARHHFEIALSELEIISDQLESLTLYYKPSQIEKRLAQTLQRQWKDAFGFTIQLIQLDCKSHAERLQNRDYQISLASWIAQFDDPISILERFKDKANLKNYPGWEDGDYVYLLNLANHSDKREGLLQAAENLFASQMPLTPIYHWNSPILCNPRLDKVGTTPCGGILFERFRLSW